MSDTDPRSRSPDSWARPGIEGKDEPETDTKGVPEAVDLLIAGGGPIGLILANLLGRRGLRVLVVERRIEPPLHSMAIGITPPSLALLQRLGLDETFIRQGVSIDTARVFENGRPLGDVDFSRLPADHRFILSLPQSTTVRILEENLVRLPSVRFVRGVEVFGLRHEPDGIQATLRDMGSGGLSTVSASYLAGCDGFRSAVRRLAGIRKWEKKYRSRFIMADFDDHTDLNREAHLFFGREGSVESFPLPDGQRRWIVSDKTPPLDPSQIGSRIVATVRRRTGMDLSASARHFQSTFQPARLRVNRYCRDRVLLCGDAAHVMSPIGGQGMNTGFADAAHLDRALARALVAPKTARREFARYHAARKRAFRIAADRAALGMWLGTRTGSVWSLLRRRLIAGVLLRRPIRQRLAPYFAMLTIPGCIGQRPGLTSTEGDTP